MAEQARGNFWIYVWLGVSGLLNLSGMASIADGFVVWARFFHDIIDIYRAVIRQPLAWIGHLIWPFGPIPGWVFDTVVVLAAIGLSWSIHEYQTLRETPFSRAFKENIEDDGIVGAVRVVVFFIPAILYVSAFVIVGAALSLLGEGEKDERIFYRGVALNFSLILAAFTLLLFINWQIRQHGG